MAEARQVSFFSEQSGELTFVAPVPDNIIDLEQYRQPPAQTATDNNDYKGGPSVNLAERQKAMSQLLEDLPQSEILRGLVDKINTTEGWKNHQKEWNESRKKQGKPEGTKEEFRQYISNVREKYKRLRAGMLADVAILAASKEMRAWGYMDEDFANSEPQVWLLKFREEYKDAGKRDDMAKLVNKEHYYSSKGEPDHSVEAIHTPGYTE